MYILGDVGNTDTKLFLVNSRNKILKKKLLLLKIFLLKNYLLFSNI